MHRHPRRRFSRSAQQFTDSITVRHHRGLGYRRPLLCELLEDRRMLGTWCVDDITDPLEDGSYEHPFDTVQEAINIAANGDEVVLFAGTYIGNGNRDLDTLGKAITIRSTDPTDPTVVESTILDARGNVASNHRVFYVHQGETENTIISGLTITGGFINHGGGIYLQQTSPSIQHCRLIDNQATLDGGAIYVNGPTSTVNIESNLFDGNSAGRDGGAIFSRNGATFLLTSNDITSNNAVRHGGGMSTVGIITLDNNDITFNTSGDDGGGIRIQSTTATFLNNRINDNDAADIGGGIACWDSTIDLQQNRVLRNEAYHAGGIYASNCTVEITNGNIVNGNAAERDVGGIYLTDVDGNIVGNEISSNTAGGVVGGLHINGNFRFDGQVSNNIVISNSDGGRGGGIDLYYGTFEIVGNVVTDNETGGEGGGIYINTCSATMKENEIARNKAGSLGGGCRFYACSELTLTSNTFKENHSISTGGAFNSAYITSLTMTDNQFIDNVSENDNAGAIMLWKNGTNTLSSNLFDGNRCMYDGGAIYTHSTTIICDHDILTNNHADRDGGAIYAFSTTLQSDHDTLTNNHADRHVGGVCIVSSDVTITNGIIENNVALSLGGIHLTEESTGTIRGTTIRNNHCAGPGGGIDIYNSQAVIEDNLIEGNSGTEGGGISIRNYSHVEIVGNQIIGNLADVYDGGGIRVDHSLAYIDRNLIADNDCKEGYGGGIYCYLSSPLLRWNVLENNYAPNPGTQLASYCGSPWLVNNVLFVNDPRIPADLAQINARERSMPLVVNSIIWGTGPSFNNPNAAHLYYSNTSDGPLFPEDDNISVAPEFVNVTDPLGPDEQIGTLDDGFQLLPPSSCINAGHMAFLDPDGSRSDMGAYGDARPVADLADIYVSWLNLAGPWDGTAAHPYRHIWEAILAAGDDDTIHVGSGYYEENLVFRSDKANLTISGEDTVTTIVNGTRRRQMAGVTEAWFAENLEVAGLTLQNGQAGHGGAMRIIESQVSIHDNVLRDCQAIWQGGGIHLESSARAIIDSNQILRNDADNGGGIFVNGDCQATITNNVIAENWTSYYIWGDGGGLWIAGSPVISGNLIANNSANDGGGGIRCNNGSTPQFDHNVLYDNVATRGGGLYAQYSNFDSVNNTFSRNRATSGGGIYVYATDLEIV